MASHEVESEYEKLRRLRIEENQAMICKLFPTDEVSWEERTPLRKVQRQPCRESGTAPDLPRRRNPKRKARFRCTKYDPANEGEETDEEENTEKVVYTRNTLIVKLNWYQRKRLSSTSPENDLDVLPSSKRRRSTHRITDTTEITEGDLNLVAERVAEKRYDSENGTTCHQCRQKTDDLKTICRNTACFGVRGQFCGPCLKNRYGEDAKKALMDSNWSCPPCRGICNCSFCMKKRGRRCTGIMIHLAKEQGFNDVKSFLGD